MTHYRCLINSEAKGGRSKNSKICNTKIGSLLLKLCAKILDNSKNTCKTNSGYPKFYVLNSQLCNIMVGRITGKNTTCMQEWKMLLDCAPYGSFILG